MKKLWMLLIIIFLLTGCSCSKNLKSKEVLNKPTEQQENDLKDENNKNKLSLKKAELKSTLLKYGRIAYNLENKERIDLSPGKYFISLNEMEKYNNFDISMFVNPLTNKPCDKNDTKVLLTVNNETLSKNYELDVALACGF